MTTLFTMRQRIADEVQRGDITASSTAVLHAINSAITRYETRRFSFNEARDASISTSSGNAFVSSMPSNIIYIDSITVTVNSRRYRLEPRTYDYIDDIDSGQWSGYPDIYAWHGDTSGTSVLRLYPIPNGNYALNISFLRRLGEFTASSSSSWFTDAEEIIRSRAKCELYRHRLHNFNKAKEYSAEAEMCFKALNKETVGRVSSGRIRKSYF